MGGCPVHSGGDDRDEIEPTDDEPVERESGIDRRDFVKSAMVIGGSTAVTSLGTIAGVTPTVSADSGRISAAERDNRQHAWDEFEVKNGSFSATGHSPQPPNVLVLGLNYVGGEKSSGSEGEGSSGSEGEGSSGSEGEGSSGSESSSDSGGSRGDSSGDDGESAGPPPTPGHRRQVERALREIERHFDWDPRGVMFTIGYSSRYFDRFDEDPPEGAMPTSPEEMEEIIPQVTTTGEVTADRYDAVLVMSSQNEANLLAVEAALWGDDNGLDIEFESTFEGVFEKPEAFPDRRIGFGGSEFRSKANEPQYDVVPDYVKSRAPLSMGFIAGFDSSIPEEDVVTLVEGQRFPNPVVDEEDVPDRSYIGEVGERDPGVFAQGSLHHLSFVEIDLDTWYGDHDLDERRTMMYSPFHTARETGDVGTKLTTDSAPQDPDAREDPGPEDASPGVFDAPMRSNDGSKDIADTVPETAARGSVLTDGEPTVAHGQKTARARIDVDGDGTVEQIVLRRDWDGFAGAGDDATAGYVFYSPMRFNEYMFNLLESMHFVGFDSLDGEISHEGVGNLDEIENGIAEVMNAVRRGNYLIPPVTLRALPHPKADEATIENVRSSGDEFVVRVSGLDDGQPLDPDTVRFGDVESVNKGRGADLVSRGRRGDGVVVYRFSRAGTDINTSDARVKLFGKRQGSRKPVTATADL